MVSYLRAEVSVVLKGRLLLVAGLERLVPKTRMISGDPSMMTTDDAQLTQFRPITTASVRT